MIDLEAAPFGAKLVRHLICVSTGDGRVVGIRLYLVAGAVCRIVLDGDNNINLFTNKRRAVGEFYGSARGQCFKRLSGKQEVYNALSVTVVLGDIGVVGDNIVKHRECLAFGLQRNLVHGFTSLRLLQGRRHDRGFVFASGQDIAARGVIACGDCDGWHSYFFLFAMFVRASSSVITS